MSWLRSRRGALAAAGGALIALLSAAQKRPPAKTATRKNTMKTVVNHLSAEISVTPRPARLEELRVTVTVKNESNSPIRFNAQYFTAPALMLKFEDSSGHPVPTGGPPLPAADDGKVGRIELEPGKSVSHTYEGELIFGNPLNPGKYNVRFFYWNGTTFRSEWAGTLETSRVEFELGVTPPR